MTDKTLQDRLREYIPNGDGYSSDFALMVVEAVDRLNKLEEVKRCADRVCMHIGMYGRIEADHDLSVDLLDALNETDGTGL